MEVLALVLALGAGLIPLVAAGRGAAVGRARVAAALGFALFLGLLGLGWTAATRAPLPTPESAVVHRPIRESADGYVSSDTCRSCHPRNYATWHASYHRRMTQLPAGDAVIAPFDGATVLATGAVTYRPFRRDGGFWVGVADPSRDVEQTNHEVALLTGSHHQQRYWIHSGRGREMQAVPFIFLVEDRRWIPVSAAFLRPPQPVETNDPGLWNGACINCHATQGRTSVTGRREDADSQVAEFGIACEACHGPGADHVAQNRDPVRRYRQHLGSPDPPKMRMVNPRKLDGLAASQVCGQCHGVLGDKVTRQFPMEELLSRGRRYRPGDELGDTHFIVRKSDPALAPMIPKMTGDPDYWAKSFWPDGMVRVSGREYGGLVESPCARDPKFSCMSCHSMHPRDDDPRPLTAWADDQLAPGMDGDRACTQCHPRYEPRERLAAHTHHAPDSSGSRCMNCHMPHTSYGLLKAMRSHQVSSPSVAESVGPGRPNACNLCHLDRTLAWTAAQLEAWYGDRAPALDALQASVAAGTLWAMKGDACQRVLLAWAMGWEPAREAAGAAWLARPLAELLVDPYPAVRYVAGRSLGRQPGFERFAYDSLGAEPDRPAARARALEIWRGQVVRDARAPDDELVVKLIEGRDDRFVQLNE